jgi:plasmid stabilization system protein ParE
MVLTYVIKARAEREITKAAEWWAENRTAAPGAVRDDFADALSLLCRQPGIGTRIETGRPVQVRRYFLSRTKYWLYYRVRGDRLEVLCIWHASRGIGPKL